MTSFTHSIYCFIIILFFVLTFKISFFTVPNLADQKKPTKEFSNSLSVNNIDDDIDSRNGSLNDDGHIYGGWVLKDPNVNRRFGVVRKRYLYLEKTSNTIVKISWYATSR